MDPEQSMPPKVMIQIQDSQLSQDLTPGALVAVADILERLQKSESVGSLGAQVDWFKETAQVDPKTLDHDPARAKEDKKEIRRVMGVSAMLQLAFSALQRIQRCIAGQISACEEIADALKLRSGMATLPDEVLVTILESAAYTHDENDDGIAAMRTVQAALKLSSVCRRFQSLLASTPDLWCRISNGMNTELLSVLWGHIATPTAQIVLEKSYGRSAEEIGQFIRFAASRSHLWKRFVHGSHLIPSISDFSKEQLEHIARESHGRKFPFLSEIAIHYPDSILHDALDDTHPVFYYSTWITPKLTSLTTSNFVPLPFASAAHLTDVTISFDYSQFDGHAVGNILSLCRFLASCPNLKLLGLTLLYHVSEPVIPGWSRFVFPTVKTLQLNLVSCSEDLVKLFLDATRFPNKSSMELHISSNPESSHPQYILTAVLVESDALARLAHLKLVIDYEQTTLHILDPVFIPFSALSALRHLTLSTKNTKLGDSFEDGPFLPSVAVLDFESCSGLDREWVTHFLGRLNARGSVPKISVKNCNWMQKNISIRPVEASLWEEDDHQIDEFGDVDIPRLYQKHYQYFMNTISETAAGGVGSILDRQPVPITAGEMLRLIQSEHPDVEAKKNFGVP